MVMYEHARESRSCGKRCRKGKETGSEYLPILILMKVGEGIGFVRSLAARERGRRQTPVLCMWDLWRRSELVA